LAKEMHYCCEICICFSSTQTQGHTYTHAAEEVNPQSIGNPIPFPITSNGSEPSTTTKKKDKVTAKISKSLVTPQLGLLCLPSRETDTCQREKERQGGNKRKRELVVKEKSQRGRGGGSPSVHLQGLIDQ